jgi:hypothetical protein
MQINLKIILDVNKLLDINQNKKNLIIERIKIIKRLFDNYQLMRKEINNEKSKILVNNQIYEELKRRRIENKKLFDDKINEINSLVKKKTIILKTTQKKFKEIQIYVKRESQNYFYYRKQFNNFDINSFIFDNECLMKYKQSLNDNIKKNKYIINALLDEVIILKNRKLIIKVDDKKKNYENKNNNKLKKNIHDKLNKYLICKKEEIKYYECLKLKIKNIKYIYENKIILPKNIFLKGINNKKNDFTINTEFSQEISNCNEINIIQQTNNNEILESNTFYELLSLENNIK